MAIIVFVRGASYSSAGVSFPELAVKRQFGHCLAFTDATGAEYARG